MLPSPPMAAMCGSHLFMLCAAFINVGSEPTCGGAESSLISSEWGCRLSTLRLNGFATAANSHYPPILQNSAMRKAIEAALGGDSVALRLCLERIAPVRKVAPVQFTLPEMKSAEYAAKAATSVLAAVSDGELAPSDA